MDERSLAPPRERPLGVRDPDVLFTHKCDSKASPACSVHPKGLPKATKENYS